jgi:hypothetical protein
MSLTSADRDTAFLLANNFPILNVLSSKFIDRRLNIGIVIWFVSSVRVNCFHLYLCKRNVRNLRISKNMYFCFRYRVEVVEVNPYFFGIKNHFGKSMDLLPSIHLREMLDAKDQHGSSLKSALCCTHRLERHEKQRKSIPDAAYRSCRPSKADHFRLTTTAAFLGLLPMH